MLEKAIIFKSEKFKLHEKDNDSFIPGHDLAMFLLERLLENGLQLVNGLKSKDANLEDILDATCYYHFELKYGSDVLEFYASLLRIGIPVQNYWSVQFNKRLSFFKARYKPKMMYCFNPEIINIVENVIMEIGDVRNLMRLTDEQYSALLIGELSF